jgi:hypothetical protein
MKESTAKFYINCQNNLLCASIGLPTDAPGNKCGCFNALSPQETRNVRWDCIAGIDSFSGIADFVEMHFDELSQHFDLSGGVPRHDTYQRFWTAICPRQFVECFSEFVEILKRVCSDIISIDGKTTTKTKFYISSLKLNAKKYE